MEGSPNDEQPSSSTSWAGGIVNKIRSKISRWIGLGGNKTKNSDATEQDTQVFGYYFSTGKKSKNKPNDQSMGNNPNPSTSTATSSQSQITLEQIKREGESRDASPAMEIDDPPEDTTEAMSPLTPRRGRGRPRKNDNATNTAATAPRRGRPKKNDNATNSAATALRRGRPKRNDNVSNSAATASHCGRSRKRVTFSNTTTTKFFIRTLSSSTESHKCPKCDREFGNKGRLKNHQLVHTKPDMNLACRICRKNGFKTPHHRKLHELTHNPGFPCCGQSFGKESYLQAHRRHNPKCKALQQQ